MKRTNIVLDEALVKEALKLSGIKTRREVVDAALQMLVRQKKQVRMIRRLKGIGWEGDLDQMRRSRFSDDAR